VCSAGRHHSEMLVPARRHVSMSDEKSDGKTRRLYKPPVRKSSSCLAGAADKQLQPTNHDVDFGQRMTWVSCSCSAGSWLLCSCKLAQTNRVMDVAMPRMAASTLGSLTCGSEFHEANGKHYCHDPGFPDKWVGEVFCRTRLSASPGYWL